MDIDYLKERLMQRNFCSYFMLGRFDDRCKDCKEILRCGQFEDEVIKLLGGNMQEVYKNGSEGEIHVADTIHELVPHIKKSLENPDVKFVKVFRAKDLKNKNKFTAEEEKKGLEDYPFGKK